MTRSIGWSSSGVSDTSGTPWSFSRYSRRLVRGMGMWSSRCTRIRAARAPPGCRLSSWPSPRPGPRVPGSSGVVPMKPRCQLASICRRHPASRCPDARSHRDSSTAIRANGQAVLDLPRRQGRVTPRARADHRPVPGSYTRTPPDRLRPWPRRPRRSSSRRPYPISTVSRSSRAPAPPSEASPIAASARSCSFGWSCLVDL